MLRREGNFAGAGQQLFQKYPHLQPRERRAWTVMNARAVKQIFGRIPVQAEFVRLVKNGFIAVGEIQFREMRSPAPIFLPPISTGRVVTRRFMTSGP